MEEHAIRLYELLEAKSFEELNAEELTFVLGHLSEEEYRSQQAIMAASDSLEYTIPAPLPLTVQQKKVVFWKRSIPLYQAILAAACIIFIFSVLRREPGNSVVIPPAENHVASSAPQPLQTVSIHDTVVKFVEIIKFHEKLVRDTITIVQSVITNQPDNRMLEVNSAVNYPDITKAVMENNSSSLSEDRTAGLVPKMVNPGIFEIIR